MKIRKRRSDRSGRVRLFSPGRPPAAGREERRRFWAAIAAGTPSEDAAVGVGVPQAVGTRWFRKAGGMPPSMFGLSAKPLSGRYLSFAEREEIAAIASTIAVSSVRGRRIVVEGRASDPHQPASFCDAEARGPTIDGRSRVFRRGALFRAPFRNSSSNACLPTRRSSAAIRASYCWSRSAAAASSSKSPASYF